MAEDPTLNSRQQRKIPRDAWKAIAARHQTGESLASIARAYECTAPAIGYIVRQEKKAHDRGRGADGTAPLFLSSAGRRRPRPAPSKASGVSGATAQQEFDVGLREAMTLEISSFLVAFDGIVAARTPEAFDRLREATDHLLRATARVRIELERYDEPIRRLSNRKDTASSD